SSGVADVLDHNLNFNPLTVGLVLRGDARPFHILSGPISPNPERPCVC
ncbi:MAG: hypothetical protein ACI8RZ_007221, partial [Myxococcota bacterium]